jgi:hypothetical protein
MAREGTNFANALIRSLARTAPRAHGRGRRSAGRDRACASLSVMMMSDGQP